MHSVKKLSFLNTYGKWKPVFSVSLIKRELTSNTRVIILNYQIDYIFDNHNHDTNNHTFII